MGGLVAELPAGTVTFLFTDLVGSTRLWEEHPEEMGVALARHDAILEMAISGHRGVVFSQMGDGIAAAFGSACDAVAAAVAAQQGLAVESWPEAVGRLRARMGVHTGEGVLVDGRYVNQPLNRCARLMAVAHGGQVVMSESTEPLVRGALPDGGVLLDLGVHRLRDLAQAMRVFQVCGPGLEREFAPLRSLDAFPTNLPVQLSSFVGRVEDLAGLAEAVRKSRLVTVTGVGGVGKTRIAIQVAAEVLPSFPDGVWLCELAVAGASDEVTQVVATALGVAPLPGLPLDASVVEFLRNREALLVLDNCEHVVDAAGGLVKTVLQHCQGVRVLATSRQGLTVEGEQLWPLGSLAVPAGGEGVGAVGASDAAQLFAERATLVRPGFMLDASNAIAIGEICRCLDGIPLAIELAAARMVAMSPAQIAGLLDERFRLLTDGRRGTVQRHQTLRATVDWSYSLLAERDRRVFDRLGVFVGSFDLEAATAVASSDSLEAWDVVDALTSLVGKSMIAREDVSGNTARYAMLETLRQYARERLNDTGDADRWRRQHAEYYAEFAERAGPELCGPDELAWRPRILGEIDNLRTAVTWSLESRTDADGELAVRIVASLADLSGNNRSAGFCAWAERTATRAQSSTPGNRAAALAAAAMAANSRGDYDAALSLARDALRDGLPADSPVRFVPHAALAGVLGVGGQPDEAVAVAAEGRRLLEAIAGSEQQRSVLASVEALFSHTAGRSEAARHAADTAVHLAREARNPTALATALFTVGLASASSDAATALAALDESLALTRLGAGDGLSPMAVALAAQLRVDRGELDALGQLRDALRRGHSGTSQAQLATVLDHSLRVLASLGYAEPAAVLTGFVDRGPAGARSVMAPDELDDRKHAIERVQLDLGSERFQTAVSRGAAMSYEEAVDYALAELDRRSEERDPGWVGAEGLEPPTSSL
jgi:predicted ATPase/class 3 adenylate cyclase